MGWTSRPTPAWALATRSTPSPRPCARRCCRRPEATRRSAGTRTPSSTTSTKPCATSSPASSRPGTVAPSTCPTSPTAPRCGGCAWAFGSRPIRGCGDVEMCSGATPGPTARRGTTIVTSTPPGSSGRAGDRCVEVDELLRSIGIRVGSAHHGLEGPSGAPGAELHHEAEHAYASNDARLVRTLVERRLPAAARCRRPPRSSRSRDESDPLDTSAHGRQRRSHPSTALARAPGGAGHARRTGLNPLQHAVTAGGVLVHGRGSTTCRRVLGLGD